MLTDPHGQLHAVAASTERVQLLELFELQNHDGPCLDAFRTGAPVTAADLNDQLQQWPTLRSARPSTTASTAPTVSRCGSGTRPSAPSTCSAYTSERSTRPIKGW